MHGKQDASSNRKSGRGIHGKTPAMKLACNRHKVKAEELTAMQTQQNLHPGLVQHARAAWTARNNPGKENQPPPRNRLYAGQSVSSQYA